MKSDYAAIRIKILAMLAKQPMSTREILLAFGSPESTILKRAVHYLWEDGKIKRKSNRYPWTIV